jgi:O-antigen/teichoic acid export membrane protein
MSQRLAAVKNAAFSSASSMIESAVGLLIGVLIARSLGPEGYGHYAFAIWVCGWLVTASNHALTTTSIKFIAEARGEADAGLAAALAHRLETIQAISTAVVLAAFAAFVMANAPDEWTGIVNWILPALMVAVWARAGFWMKGALGEGYERFEPINLGVLVSAAVQLALVVLWASRGGSMLGFVAIFAIGGFAMNLSVRWLNRRCRVESRPGPIPEAIASRLRRHLWLTGVLVLLSLGTNRTVETVLLKAHGSAEALGYLAIAAALTKGAVELLSSGMSTVLLPIMSRIYGRSGEDGLRRIVPESIRYYWFLGLIVAGIGVVASDGAVRALYGVAFAEAARVVMWMLVVAGLSTWQSALNSMQISADQQAARVKVTVASLAVNVAVGLALVPVFGLDGAIASIAITRAFTVGASWWYARRAIAFAMPADAMVRLSLAACVGCGAGYLVGGAMPAAIAFVPAALAFVPAYLLASVLFRCWTPSDFDLAISIVKRAGMADGRMTAMIEFARARFAAKGLR